MNSEEGWNIDILHIKGTSDLDKNPDSDMQLTQSHAQRPLHSEGNFLFHQPPLQLQTNSFFILWNFEYRHLKRIDWQLQSHREYLTISLCVKKYLQIFSARKLMDDIELSLLQNVTLTYREKWKVSKSTLISGGKKIAKCQTHHRHIIAWKERETFCKYSLFFEMSAFGICAFERYSLVVDSLLQTRQKR